MQSITKCTSLVRPHIISLPAPTTFTLFLVRDPYDGNHRCRHIDAELCQQTAHHAHQLAMLFDKRTAACRSRKAPGGQDFVSESFKTVVIT
jgi:hypothetical protein